MGSRRPPLLADIASEVQDSSSAIAGSRVDHAFRAQLAAADDDGRQTLVRDYIRDELARIVGVAPEGLEVDQPLSSFGLDSLLALELKNNLESRLDFTLPMAKLMEGPSITSLAAETVRLVVGAPSGESDDERTAVRGLESVAVIADDWIPLIALRSSGTRPPLFLLPALGGDIRCYDELVQAPRRRPTRLRLPTARHRPGSSAAPVDARNGRRLRGRDSRAATERTLSFGRLVDRRHLRLRAGRSPGGRRRTCRSARALRRASSVHFG